MPIASSKRAFTLIEMLVVIIIIAVMTAVVIPAYTGIYASARFDLAVRSVQSIYVRARNRAVATDTTVIVQYNPSLEQFSIQDSAPAVQTDRPTAHQDTSGSNDQDSSRRNEDDFFELNHDAYMASVHNETAQTGTGAASGPASGSGGTDVQFRGDGTSDAAEIDLSDREGRTIKLIIYPANGQIAPAESDSQAGSGR